MAIRPAAVVAAALVEKGMEEKSGHHIMFRKTVDGVTQLVTRISHNSRDIDDRMGKKMANQLYLQLKEFWNLVDCPLSEEDWEALVAERSRDGRNPFLGH
jgi:hypothetical protein